jgi:4-hydroxy-3-methylbut-2-enyl diphosphate reductase
MDDADETTQAMEDSEPSGASSFDSERVDRIRVGGGVWDLPGGQLLLPKVFGFCRGVKRALVMADRAVQAHQGQAKRLFLLGQIIHNPWVNAHFVAHGVRILSGGELEGLDRLITPGDCAIIPAFGVPLPVERRLRAIGCEIIDTSCGDVRRLWAWADRASGEGYAVLIFGRAQHDETVVTKSRLEESGGKYLVVGNLKQAQIFCDMIAGRRGPGEFSRAFDPQVTNAQRIDPFLRLAQVSQTTMLYDETMELRELVRGSFIEHFGEADLAGRLLFQPTVCRATQARQAAAVDLCRQGCDLIVVVGGFGSSNTRHLYEVARKFSPAYFIEDARAILSAHSLQTIDPATHQPLAVDGWLPAKRPLRIGLLAGASSPEVVIGQVLERLSEFLG